jgi:HD superfamily phosphohydrolase
MSSLTQGLHDPIRLNKLLRESTINLNLNLVCYLISGKDSYLGELDERQKRQAKIIHALTSELLDLDRIDYYRRDSEFMGLEIGFNYQALLHGLIVLGKSDGSAINLRIANSALGHALSLLHLRERLTVDCFYDDRSLSLGAMCPWAIARFLEVEKNSGVEQKNLLGYLFRGDDELLHLLRYSSDPGVRSMASRLAANQPFLPIGCCKLRQTKNLRDIDNFIKNIDTNYYDNPVVLYKAHPSIKNWPSNDEWLALDHLLDENDNQLGESGPYANQIRHFKTVASTQNRNVWFFVADSSRITEIIAQIHRADLWEGVSGESPIAAA